jgi:ATP-dependent DNA helicase RecG
MGAQPTVHLLALVYPGTPIPGSGVPGETTVAATPTLSGVPETVVALPGRLDRPLARDVGERTAAILERHLGFTTVRDLVEHHPRTWLRARELTRISDLAVDELVTFIAEVARVHTRPMRQRKGSITEVVVTDGRDELSLTYFNQRGLERRLPVGARALFSGTVSRHRRVLQLVHPSFQTLEDAGDDALTPLIAVYPASGAARSEVIGGAVRVVLDTLRSQDVPDPLPEDLLRERGLPDRVTALRGVHRPRTEAERDTALDRFRFEEALVLQTALVLRRREARGHPAVVRRPGDHGVLSAFDARLPFELTGGQRAVSEEIAADLASGTPMQRLLQGEVGTGKTLVALRAMLAVVDAGGQAALLAPTEVLAAQHHRTITELLGELGRAGTLDGDPDGTRVALVTGSLGAAARRRTLADVASGAAGVVVGTHALLSDPVQFADLGLVVVDEQHRFGVEQRDALRSGRLDRDGRSPHLLVMTATPIPRTVAMTAFGDLDVSTLTEVPAGRAEVVSHVVSVAERPAWLSRVWQRVREEVDRGRQAFVVCPRIGDPPGEAPGGGGGSGRPGDDEVPGEPGAEPGAGVLATLESLRAHEALAGLRVEPLHGRLDPDVKDATMRAFAAGDVDVLVATTVVEVGVDVPNATVMVVLDADRFGVSQLHQLRGRVGRGSAGGLCLLVTSAAPESAARRRLDAVAATRDGLALARLDLQLRREGDVLGAAQSGRRSSLRYLRVLDHEDVIVAARAAAEALVAEDPDLADHAELRRAIAERVDPDRQEFLDRA